MIDDEAVAKDPEGKPAQTGDPAPKGATAVVYERLGITDEEVGDVAKIAGGELELDVAYSALGGNLFVDATIRISRRPLRSTIVRLSVETADVWRTLLASSRLKDLPRATIHAAFVAFDQASRAGAESKMRADVLDALASPGSGKSIRAFPDAEFIDLAVRIDELMSRPDSDFTGRSGPTRGRSLSAVGRLLEDEEAKRVSERRKTIGATSHTTWRKKLDEAIRRGFINESTYGLTEKGRIAHRKKADAEREARREQRGS